MGLEGVLAETPFPRSIFTEEIKKKIWDYFFFFFKKAQLVMLAYESQNARV